jgi:uncharacterized protein (DUF697 family)
MAGKKLPRAITTTADEMRGAAASAALVEPKPPASRATVMSPSEPSGSEPGQIVSLRGDDAIVAHAEPAIPDTAKRRELAQDIVQRHAAYSVVGGIIPLPIVNAASVTAINLRMVKMLSDLYGVPFERDRARAIIVGLMGGIMPTGVGAITTSTLLYIIPGSNLIGLAMSSVTAAACTRGIGRVFVEHFENGALAIEPPATARA